MTATSLIALCAALPIAGDGVPEWVHLLPAGVIETGDKRGPYTVASLQALAETLRPGDKLPIDECHSTDLAAPRGEPAPARGWIVALEARADGLWGKVEWTAHGRQLMEDRAYRGISPVILHTRAKQVVGLLRASLINTPNLKGLVALHSKETGMDWKTRLIELLKLDGEADDAAIETALQAKMEGDGDGAAKPALQSVVESPEYLALQSQCADLATALNALEADRAREKAVAFVDAAMAEGRAGLNATSRDEYVALHMENPARAEALIGAMPRLTGTTHASQLPADSDDSGLTAADRQVIALMGLSEEEYAASLSASGKQKEAL